MVTNKQKKIPTLLLVIGSIFVLSSCLWSQEALDFEPRFRKTFEKLLHEDGLIAEIYKGDEEALITFLMGFSYDDITELEERFLKYSSLRIRKERRLVFGRAMAKINPLVRLKIEEQLQDMEVALPNIETTSLPPKGGAKSEESKQAFEKSVAPPSKE